MSPCELAAFTSAAAIELVGVCGEDAELIAATLVAIGDQMFLILSAQQKCENNTPPI